MTRGLRLTSGVGARRHGRSPSGLVVVDVANLAAAPALVERDCWPAATATGVVDLVVISLDRHEVDRLAAVDDGEVRDAMSD